MELKEAYKTGLKNQLEPLVKTGKIQLLGTLEEMTKELVEAFFLGLEEGAYLSATKSDDAVVPAATAILRTIVAPHLDKIDGK